MRASPYLAETVQARLSCLWVPHPAEPVAHRVGIGDRVVAEQRGQRRFTRELSEVFECAAACLQHQDDGLDDDRGGVAPVTARLREQAIDERPQTEAVGELSQQGEAPMGGQRLICSFELEGQQTFVVSWPHLVG